MKKQTANPSKNTKLGWRTQQNIAHGKNIRRAANGFEIFDDYWTESEADDSSIRSLQGVDDPNDNKQSNHGEGIFRKPRIKSMSPFSCDDTVTPRESVQHTKELALNNGGEPTGTLSRTNTTGAPAATADSSALYHFNSKKRLTYSDGQGSTSTREESQMPSAGASQSTMAPSSTESRVGPSSQEFASSSQSGGVEESQTDSHNSSSVQGSQEQSDAATGPEEANPEGGPSQSGGDERESPPSKMSKRKAKSDHTASTSQGTDQPEEPDHTQSMNTERRSPSVKPVRNLRQRKGKQDPQQKGEGAGNVSLEEKKERKSSRIQAQKQKTASSSASPANSGTSEDHDGLKEKKKPSKKKGKKDQAEKEATELDDGYTVKSPSPSRKVSQQTFLDNEIDQSVATGFKTSTPLVSSGHIGHVLDGEEVVCYVDVTPTSKDFSEIQIDTSEAVDRTESVKKNEIKGNDKKDMSVKETSEQDDTVVEPTIQVEPDGQDSDAESPNSEKLCVLYKVELTPTKKLKNDQELCVEENDKGEESDNQVNQGETDTADTSAAPPNKESESNISPEVTQTGPPYNKSESNILPEVTQGDLNGFSVNECKQNQKDTSLTVDSNSSSRKIHQLPQEVDEEEEEIDFIVLETAPTVTTNAKSRQQNRSSLTKEDKRKSRQKTEGKKNSILHADEKPEEEDGIGDHEHFKKDKRKGKSLKNKKQSVKTLKQKSSKPPTHIEKNEKKTLKDKEYESEGQHSKPVVSTHKENENSDASEDVNISKRRKQMQPRKIINQLTETVATDGGNMSSSTETNHDTVDKASKPVEKPKKRPGSIPGKESKRGGKKPRKAPNKNDLELEKERVDSPDTNQKQQLEDDLCQDRSHDEQMASLLPTEPDEDQFTPAPPTSVNRLVGEGGLKLTVVSPSSGVSYRSSSQSSSKEAQEGLRRSQRVRIQPLDWYKNERVVNDKRATDAGAEVLVYKCGEDEPQYPAHSEDADVETDFSPAPKVRRKKLPSTRRATPATSKKKMGNRHQKKSSTSDETAKESCSTSPENEAIVKKHARKSVTINPKVHMSPGVALKGETTPLAAEGAATPRSILKKNHKRGPSMAGSDSTTPLPRFSTATPVHYCDVTTTKTPALPVRKIIAPKEAPEGVRRSKRTRVRPLEWYKNERILYDRRKSGLYIVGIQSPLREKPKGSSMKTGRRKAHKKIPATPRNLSVHGDLPTDYFEEVEDEIPVMDADSEEEVLMDCIQMRDSYEYIGPSSEKPTEDDPFIVCKVFRQPTFSTGELIIRPLQEKCMQFVRSDTMVFTINKGKLAVTIHQSTVILESGDQFFVPPGNSYSIRNLRKDEAKLIFFQQKVS